MLLESMSAVRGDSGITIPRGSHGNDVEATTGWRCATSRRGHELEEHDITQDLISRADAAIVVATRVLSRCQEFQSLSMER